MPNQMPFATLITTTAGLVVGLVIAALISIPLFNLDGWFSWGIPLIISFSLGLIGMWVGSHRSGEMSYILPKALADSSSYNPSNGRILVDTSAIIDGRIADLGLSGFIQGTLIIPGFVMDELRHIADSNDSLRRARGRNGLEALAKLRKETNVPIQILDAELFKGAEVDSQLVKLAKSMKSSHSDYGLQSEQSGRGSGHSGAQRKRASQRL